MEANILDNGIIIKRMDKVKKKPLIILFILDTIRMGKNMDLAKYYELMAIVMKEILMIMKYKVKENIYGVIKEYTMAVGIKEKCMVKENWPDGKRYLFFLHWRL